MLKMFNTCLSWWYSYQKLRAHCSIVAEGGWNKVDKLYFYYVGVARQAITITFSKTYYSIRINRPRFRNYNCYNNDILKRNNNISHLKRLFFFFSIHLNYMKKKKRFQIKLLNQLIKKINFFCRLNLSKFVRCSIS